MKKTLGMFLVISIFLLFISFFPTSTLTQTFAEEKTNTDIESLKKELEEEKEALVELDDELNYITEREKETHEAIDYLKTSIKELESSLQKGDEPGRNLQEELNSAKEKLGGEMASLEEIRDEMDVIKELKKETEERITELTAQIQKTESTTVAPPQGGQPTKPPQQAPVNASKLPPASTDKPKQPTKKELEEQLRTTKETLEEEITALEDAEDEISILQEEIQEITELKQQTEAKIHELLGKIKELESAIASTGAKEGTQSSAETKSPDAESVKK